MLFELNCNYHPLISYEEDVDSCFKFLVTDKLSTKIKQLMIVCQKMLDNISELQKQAYDKRVKPWSYVPGNRVWLNSKYIRTKINHKLKPKFFDPFLVLYPVGKQDYKLDLSRK